MTDEPTSGVEAVHSRVAELAIYHQSECAFHTRRAQHYVNKALASLPTPRPAWIAQAIRDQEIARHHAFEAQEALQSLAALATPAASPATEARIRELEDALDGIYVYCNDTLSGRADGGSDDRAWQREAVVKARNFARPFSRSFRFNQTEG